MQKFEFLQQPLLVYASSQGQRTHSARTKIIFSDPKLPYYLPLNSWTTSILIYEKNVSKNNSIVKVIGIYLFSKKRIILEPKNNIWQNCHFVSIGKLTYWLTHFCTRSDKQRSQGRNFERKLQTCFLNSNIYYVVVGFSKKKVSWDKLSLASHSNCPVVWQRAITTVCSV